MRILANIVLFLLASFPLHANDTAFGGQGALPFPVSETGIRMLSEKITIVGHHLNQEGWKGEWNYTCHFTFQNMLDKPMQIKMGFPFPIYDELSEVAIPEKQTLRKGDPLIYGFIVHVNDRLIPAEKQKIAANEEKGLYYTDAYLWNMSFLPRQTVEITHRYKTGATFDALGFHWITYVLKTGGLWKDGSIGHTDIEVIPNTPTRLCSELDLKSAYLKPLPPGIKIIAEGKNRIYRWNLKNFRPQEDLRLCLQTGKNYVRYQLLYPLLQEENAISLKKLSRAEVNLLKNTVYAQYGRPFKSQKLQSFFNKQWWYEINPNYSDALLSTEDKKILAILQIQQGESP
ncbi:MULTISPECIES: YARHG domain-containing protein [Legionella]|uniref:YARHG domain-containing protein n=1 Tax=Legionella TaxID=445 RepID=UPI000F8C83AF|nr:MULTISPECIES: YARHG domain-containing protein [Legionella]MCP0914219.1 YARHG domain-containing protein [Legionella sp. 27cVA30]RUR00559.1 YARHG domain-containing protein [Legionella septentrionalis]RUR11760.1 YARHG domain-containing protein [Legionella septentrionalis]RUR17448.1 YARHG domain-containing protein [Legionella septentrionalis]